MSFCDTGPVLNSLPPSFSSVMSFCRPDSSAFIFTMRESLSGRYFFCRSSSICFCTICVCSWAIALVFSEACVLKSTMPYLAWNATSSSDNRLVSFSSAATLCSR